jgi:L-malate glycosyltransferase
VPSAGVGAEDGLVVEPKRFLIIYAQPSFWSMGTGIGAGSFSRTPRALAERGHEVHVVLPAEPGMPEGEEEWEGVRLHRFASGTSFQPPYAILPLRLLLRVTSYLAYQSAGTRTALAIARKVKPDLVVSFGPFEAPVARRVARRIGIPNVVRLFGNGLSLSLHNRVKFLLNFPEVIAFRTPCARLILTNDGANGEAVAVRCGIPPERFVHLRNGLDFAHFTPGPPDMAVFRRLGVDPASPLLITVTRLALEKKIERLIEAMPALLRRCPSAVAVLVGEGPERPRLEDLARSLGVADSVKIPGAVPNKDLPAYYRSAAVVLSLLDRTNASNPVFEAMACGRCVVALDTGTTSEIVVPDRTGLLLKREDLPRLGGLLADLLADPQGRARLGAAGRAHVRGLLLDPPERMDQEIGILLQVIEEAKQGRCP